VVIFCPVAQADELGSGWIYKLSVVSERFTPEIDVNHQAMTLQDSALKIANRVARKSSQGRNVLWYPEVQWRDFRRPAAD
jgi:hypothetical protein